MYLSGPAKSDTSHRCLPCTDASVLFTPLSLSQIGEAFLRHAWVKKKIGCLKDSEVLITGLQYLILKLQKTRPVITTRLTIDGVQILSRHMTDEKGRIQVSLYAVSVYDAPSVAEAFLSVLTG